MTAKAPVRHCAVYTRKSSEEGLEQNFNSLHAQREACEAFIRSQRGEGWRLRGQSRANPSSGQISLLTGEITGNIAKLGPIAASVAGKALVTAMA